MFGKQGLFCCLWGRFTHIVILPFPVESFFDISTLRYLEFGVKNSVSLPGSVQLSANLCGERELALGLAGSRGEEGEHEFKEAKAKKEGRTRK